MAGEISSSHGTKRMVTHKLNTPCYVDWCRELGSQYDKKSDMELLLSLLACHWNL